MDLASLLCGGGLQTQINPLAGVLGGSTTDLLGTSGVPNELAGLCALPGNQQSHNDIVSLTHLQDVELQRAVAAQKLATETQAAAAVHAKIDGKVAEELKKVAPSNLPTQPVQTVHAAQPEKNNDYGDGDLMQMWLRCKGATCVLARTLPSHSEKSNACGHGLLYQSERSRKA